MNTNYSVDLLCMSCLSPNDNNGVCPLCGFDEKNYQPSPHHLPLRTILNGKYMVGRVLGEGGFGITYIGWDLNLDLKIAIKEYYPTGFVTRENTVTNTVVPFTGEKTEFFQSGREKFVDEAKRLAKFFVLSGIVAIKDFFIENDTAYIVMEYVEGETLKQYLSRMGGKISPDKAFELMKPLMNSLIEIHKEGIIHRDISPDNIMITKTENIKLIDFGAARDFANSGNRSLSVMLKPGYAPEEQYRSRGVQGPWTDIYALCATIYKAITGVTPDESIERIHNDELKKPSELGVEIHPQLENAIIKGMAVLHESRYHNISEMLEVFNCIGKEASDDRRYNSRTEYEEDRKEVKSDHKSDHVIRINKKRPGYFNLAILAAVAVVLIVMYKNGVFQNIITNTEQTESTISDDTDVSDLPVEPLEVLKEQPATVKTETPSITLVPTETILNYEELGFYSGNTSGNIANGGDVVQQGDWIYYSKNGIHKINLDGNNNTELCSDEATYMAISDEWIYYSNTTDNFTLYKIKIDGTNRTKLVDESCSYINVVDDWIYCSLNGDKYRGVYKIKTDAGNIEILCEDRGDLTVVDGWIYGRSYTDGCSYKIKTDGTEDTCLSEDCFGIVVYDQWIYSTGKNKLYKMKLDGSKKIVLDNEGNIPWFNVSSEWIYFVQEFDDGFYRVKIKLDGSDKTIITDKFYNMNILLVNGEIWNN